MGSIPTFEFMEKPSIPSLASGSNSVKFRRYTHFSHVTAAKLTVAIHTLLSIPCLLLKTTYNCTKNLQMIQLNHVHSAATDYVQTIGYRTEQIGIAGFSVKLD